MDTENYFQLIRGTNPSKKPHPGQQPKEMIRVKIRRAEHYCTTDMTQNVFKIRTNMGLGKLKSINDLKPRFHFLPNILMHLENFDFFFIVSFFVKDF